MAYVFIRTLYCQYSHGPVKVMRSQFSLVYGYRKTAVKAPCLSSIKSSLVASSAAECLSIVGSSSSPMTLWGFTVLKLNSVNFKHLYRGSVTESGLGFNKDKCAENIQKEFFLWTCTFHDSLRCPWDKLVSWILQEVRYCLHKAECALFYINENKKVQGQRDTDRFIGGKPAVHP